MLVYVIYSVGAHTYFARERGKLFFLVRRKRLTTVCGSIIWLLLPCDYAVRVRIENDIHKIAQVMASPSSYTRLQTPCQTTSII